MAQAQHERLEVYTHALDLASSAEAVARALPDYRSDLRDQIRRAAASIPLNIAEGAGEFSPADKSKFYRYARRSAAECAAVLDVIERTTPLQADLARPRDLVSRIGAMLTVMIKSVEKRKK